MGDGTAVSLHLCFDWRVKKNVGKREIGKPLSFPISLF